MNGQKGVKGSVLMAYGQIRKLPSSKPGEIRHFLFLVLLFICPPKNDTLPPYEICFSKWLKYQAIKSAANSVCKGPLLLIDWRYVWTFFTRNGQKTTLLSSNFTVA